MEKEIDLVDSVLKAIPTEPLPDLGPAVLRRIEESERAASAVKGRSWLERLWTPRPIVLNWRPAYSFAMAAAAIAFVIAPPGVQQQVPVPTAAMANGKTVLVQFRLDAPRAKQVSLAGDFTNWQPAHKLIRSEPGVWTIVVPLSPGVHDYAFVVDDGRWTPDPMAPAIADGFGGSNSRLAVLEPDPRAGT
jgi:hypothetical protein